MIGATSGKNIAMYRSVHQSSYLSTSRADYEADDAVDGNENSKFQTLTCMRTGPEHNPWFTLDLAARETIQKVCLTSQVRFGFWKK